MRQLPAEMRDAYRSQAQAFMSRQPGARKIWYESGLEPDQNWERTVARTRFLARVPLDASWLLWVVIAAQAGGALCAWQLHWQQPVVIRNIGTGLAGLVLPALIALLYSSRDEPATR